MLKKRFSFLAVGWLPLLMSVLLIGALGVSTAQAQSVAASSTVDTLKVQLQNKAVQDSVALSTPILVRVNTPVAGDTIAIALSGDFRFATSGKYYVDTLKSKFTVDSARVNATMDTLYVKIVSNTTSSTADSISIANVRVVPTQVTSVNRWGLFADVLGLYCQASGRTASPPKLKALRLVPGSFYKYVATPSTTNTTITAGDTANATATNVTLVLQDYNSNATLDSTIVPTVKGSLSGSAIATGTGTVLTSLFSRTFNSTTTNQIVMDLGYTKTDNPFYFAFVAPSDTVFSSAITVQAAAAANVSASLLSGKSDTFTVDGSTGYVVTVTDKYFNPAPSVAVTAAEAINHGGQATKSSANTNSSGQDTITFVPSKSYVGSDSLKVTAGSATYYRAMTINPGQVGGLIVDYSGSSDGAATTEKIAAGNTVYVRGFLRDTYGNPINVTSASQMSFAVTSKTGVKAALNTSGAVMDTVTESQYPNANKSAIGVAVPFSVAQNVRTVAGQSDTVTVSTSGGYSLPVAIFNRSNVPYTMKLVQPYDPTIGDSSAVASMYATASTITLKDTVLDQYGNKVDTTGSATWTLAPKKSAYAVFFASKGIGKFKRTADTTTADTLYPGTGVVTDSISAGKVTGVDTVTVTAVGGATSWMPFYVTPAVYAQLVITPGVDTTTVAGRKDSFLAEKQDQFGNHIDWGLAGGDALGRTYSRTKPSNTPSATTDSAKTTLAILSSRTGAAIAASNPAVVGTASKYGASISGSLDYAFTYTSAPASADTAKFYAMLGVGSDTVLVRSIPTGALASFKIAEAKAGATGSDTVRIAGDSLKVTLTPLDGSGNTIYTYVPANQVLTLNHTAIKPVVGDSTFYFSYVDKNGKYHTTTGPVPDSVFVNGSAVFTLHKFTSEQDSMATITFADTSAKVSATSRTFNFVPARVDTSYGYWAVDVPDTLNPSGAFSFTVTPRDVYYNVNKTQQVIINISSNQTSGFNVGSNPKVITGSTTFNGALSTAVGNLVIYVFDNTNSHIYGQSMPSVLTGVQEVTGLPKTFALDQNYPNPFNPTTNIKYDVPKMASVKIVIYDILGREVRTLVNDNMAAGRYTAVWNGLNNYGEQVSSGVYFYRMNAGSFVSMKKMLLLK